MEVSVAKPEELSWLTERIGGQFSPELRALKVTDREGRIVGMVGFDSWTHSSCEMHLALDSHAAARPILKSAFRMAFGGLGRSVVFARVRSDNPRALQLDKHLGFREAAVLKDAWDVGVDLHVLELRREDCRWPKERDHG